MTVNGKISRKQQIEEKATELFKDRGYSASSMRDLANVLGIEAASLYSHISSKEEILRTICFRMVDEFWQAIGAVDFGSKNYPEKLEAFVIAHVQVITRDTSSSAVFFNEWKHLSEPYLSDFLDEREKYEQKFRGILREGMVENQFVELDDKIAALTLLSSLNWVYHWYKPDGNLTSAEIGKSLASTMTYGILKK